MNEKAVSEAIGFILILGIVISGIGLVTLYGYPVLVKEQSNTDVRNMERAMIIIQNDMKSLCYKNVPYKETSLQVSGGTLEVIGATDGATPKFSISADGSEPVEFSPGALVYRSDRGNEVITLENGAVMTRQEGSAGSAMLAEPRWFYDNSTKTFVIYIMKITTNDLMAKSGMATVRMSLDTPSTLPIDNPGTVTVTYNDPSAHYSTAWRNYLTSPTVGMKQEEGFLNTYKIPNVDKLVIKEYKIEILGI